MGLDKPTLNATILEPLNFLSWKFCRAQKYKFILLLN